MAKKVYDSYNYDEPVDEYTYSDSSVLRNKFDIKDSDLARIIRLEGGNLF